MKKILGLAAAIILCFSAAAESQPLAKEISFQRDCARGVPLYDSATGKVSCGVMKESGVGYVVEMAVQAQEPPSCPNGYNYIGNLDRGSLVSRGIRPTEALQYFACAKG